MSELEEEFDIDTDFEKNRILPKDEDWQKWLRICDYTGWEPNGFLQPINWRGRILPYNAELGVVPHFFIELMEKVNKVKPIRMTLVGEAGSSKTYTAISIADVIDPQLTVDQIVLKGQEFIKIQRILPSRKCIVLEEPTFHLAARTWYDVWQRIIVQTIESTRFENNPLFIPVVNRNLIDKTVREYYINYTVEMYDRGIGRVFRTKHSQWVDHLTRRTAYNIYLFSPGQLIAECGRDTCLECPELWKCIKGHDLKNCNKSCDDYIILKDLHGSMKKEFKRFGIEECIYCGCHKNIFPAYERKRARAIAFYQEQGEKEIEKAKEDVSFADYCDKAVGILEKLVDSKGKKYMYEEVQYFFNVSTRKAHEIVRWLEKHYPLGV